MLNWCLVPERCEGRQLSRQQLPRQQLPQQQLPLAVRAEPVPGTEGGWSKGWGGCGNSERSNCWSPEMGRVKGGGCWRRDFSLVLGDMLICLGHELTGYCVHSYIQRLSNVGMGQQP